MRKIKILTPILGIASVASIAIPLTSCGSSTAKLTSIAIKTQATKKDFNVGDTFTSAGLVITVTYSNGSTKSVNSGESGLSTNFDNKTFTDADKGNDKEVTVSYKENDVSKTTTYKINVNPAAAALTSIAIKTQPTKTNFVAQQTFNSDGLVITATYSDATTEDISSGATGLVTNYDNTTFTEDDVGNNKDVTITYTKGSVSKTTTYKINVTSAILKLTKDTTQNEQDWYINGGGEEKVTLYPGITYKATIENITIEGSETGVNAMVIMHGDEDESGQYLYKFSYITGSAKNKGETITSAQYHSVVDPDYELDYGYVQWDTLLTEGSFEISFKVESEITSFVNVIQYSES